MSTILDLNHNTMTNVRAGHTPMSDMFGNPYGTHIFLILLLLCQLYQFLSPCTNGGHMDFIPNGMSKVLYDYITMSGITEARMLDTKNKSRRLFCRS